MKTYLPAGMAILIIILFYFCFSLFNYSHIHEDAFIYFRCIENAVNGNGYAFNPGDRIEACSSITWLFLLIPFLKSGFNLLIASKILGIVFGCLSLSLIFVITRTFTNQMPWVILPAFLTSFSLPFTFWNQLGLETSMYTFIFLSLIFTCLNKRIFLLWPINSILLVLTRPEGAFLLLGLLPVFYFYREWRKKIIYSSLFFVISFITIVLLRLLYFHDFLPSPFYIKIYSGKLSEGFFYIHSFLKDNYIYLLLAPLLYLIWKKCPWERSRVVVLGFIAVYLLWVSLGGSEGIFKPFFRYLVPVIPLLYIYSITGIEKVFNTSRAIKQVGCIMIVLIGCLGLFLPRGYTVAFEPAGNPFANNIKKFFKSPAVYLNGLLNRVQDPAQFNYAEDGRYQQIRLGEFIKSNYSEGTLLLYDQMGQVPFQAGIEYQFVDSWGLTDIVIGRYYFNKRAGESGFLKLYQSISGSIINRLFPSEKFIYTKDEIIDYIYGKGPDVMLVSAITCYLRDYLPHWIITDSRLKNDYHLKYFTQGTLVFERNGLEKKPLSIPDGLSVVYDKDIYNALREDLLIQNWAKMISDDFWKSRHLADWLAEYTVL